MNEDKEYKIYDCVPYQTCPVCNGSGKILNDGFIANSYRQCDVCNGTKIIPMSIVPIQFDIYSDN